MITKDIDKAVGAILEDLYLEIQPNDNPANTTLEDRKREMMALIRMEAINLADRIIGKDRVLHAHTDVKEGVMRLDREDKAVFDFQVQQRIKLAQYQNPQIGAEHLLNEELSENEA